MSNPSFLVNTTPKDFPFQHWTRKKGAIPISPSQRHKLWEIEPRFHCCIVGLCLRAKELRQICKKAGIDTVSPKTEYQYHQILVELAKDQDLPSKLTQKLLDKKYSRIVNLFAQAKSSEALKTLWDKTKEEGDVAGGFWALVTQKKASISSIDVAYGEIHMLSLSSISSRRNLQKSCTYLQRETAGLKKQLAETHLNYKKWLQASEDVIKKLTDQLAVAENTGIVLTKAVVPYQEIL